MGIQRIDYLGASVELWKGGFIDMEMNAMNDEDIFCNDSDGVDTVSINIRFISFKL